MVWILIAILGTLVILGIIAILYSRKHKRPVDYYNLFIIGILWAIIGIPIKNYVLSAAGAVFVFLGLLHKKEWKKNKFRWSDLEKSEKKWQIVIMILLSLLILASFVAFILLLN